jgi:hypothetical protein
MMTSQANAEQLLRRYEQGRVTAKGLILAVLSIPDRECLTKTMQALPAGILEQLKDFVASYRPGMRVFHGPRPKVQSVRFVREWLDRAGNTTQVPQKRALRKSTTS